MLVILKLMFNYWKRSFPNWFFNFVFPLLLMVLLRSFGTEMQILLPNLLISGSLGSGLFGLAITYADIKNSIILKKIRSTPLPKWKVVGGIISFNILMSWIASLWVFTVGALFFRSEIVFSQINWFYLFLAVFLSIIMASLIGFIIGSLVPDVRTAGVVANLINLPATLLTGLYVPLERILKNETLSKLVKFIPFSYPATIIKRAGSHTNLAAIKDKVLFDNYHLPIIFSCLWIIGLSFAAFYVYQSWKE